MNVISNKYISLGVGTPLNKKNFTLASTVDTTSFIGGGTFTEKAITTTGIDDAKVLRITMTAAQTTANKTVLESIGLVNSFQDQVTILNNKPEYEVLWTGGIEQFSSRNDGCQFTFTEIPIGEEIDNWDETKLMLFTKSDSPNMDGGNWRSVRANATWNASTQYYYCNEAGALYYITDKNNPNKRLRFYLGEGPLSYDNKRMSLCILSTYAGASDNYDGWWTTQVYDPDTQTTTNQRLVVSSQSGTFVRAVTTINGVSNLFAGTNRARDMSSSTYNTGWLTGTSDETKERFKMYHTLNTKFTNSTITQFGQVKKGDRTYFGIWVAYPKTQHYVGLKADADISLAASHGTSAGDMRSYGMGEIEKPHYENLEIEEVEFYGIELSKININIDIKEGQTPPDVNYNPNVSAIWPALDPTVLKGRQLGSLVSQYGFHIYRLYWSDFNESILGKLWSWGSLTDNMLTSLTEGQNIDPIQIISAIVSGGASWLGQSAGEAIRQSRLDPLAAIAFARVLPKFTRYPTHETLVTKVSIAGVDVPLTQITESYKVYDEVIPYDFTIDCSTLMTTASYLDYAPYSTAEIYLPYIGVVQVDPTDFVGGSIHVQYNCCIIDGTISAHLTCYPGYSSAYPVQYGPFVGSGSFEYPLAQKDANAFQRQLGYVKAIGAGVTGALGGIVTSGATLGNAIKTAGSGLLDSMTMKQNFRGSQLGSGSAIVVPTNVVKVMVTTPLPKYLSFEELNKFGTASGKITTVQNAQRAGQTTFCKFKYFDASSISEATPEEKDAIQRAFVGGVYI